MDQDVQNMFKGHKVVELVHMCVCVYVSCVYVSVCVHVCFTLTLVASPPWRTIVNNWMVCFAVSCMHYSYKGQISKNPKLTRYVTKPLSSSYFCTATFFYEQGDRQA